MLTAVVNHHDALRLRRHRAGTWEQDIGEPQEFDRLRPGRFPSDRTRHEREAVLAILTERVAGQDLSPPLTAIYVRVLGCLLPGAACTMAGDNASREILVTDIFTAFGQRLAGEDIALQPTTTGWREWSQRCAALATHPAVVESRDFWLENASKTTLRLTGRRSPNRRSPIW